MKSQLINSCNDLIEKARERGRRCALNNLPHGVNGDPTTSLCVEGEYGYIPLLTCPDIEVEEANEALGLSKEDVRVIVFSTFHDPDRANKDPELKDFTYINETKKAFELNLSEEELRIIWVALNHVRLDTDKLDSLKDEVYEALQNNYLLDEVSNA